ncbi:MAG: hypothetical protein JEZ04_22025 [Spirochaetales bacterium]|nr:hypothetical protein [Spirochaetales bacterium]
MASLLADKTREELVGIITELARVFPEVYRNIHDTAQLEKGDIKAIEKRLRAEINTMTAADVWYDPWNDEGNLSDYSHLEEQLNALLKKGCADTVVRLGTELWEGGVKQMEQSGAVEGITEVIAPSMDIVMEALPRTSMRPSEQILWYIERNLTDDYGMLSRPLEFADTSVYEENQWNDVAASLEKRLESMELLSSPSFSERYSRYNIVKWLRTAYEKSGQKQKRIPLMEKEADYCQEYMPLIDEFIKAKNYKKARAWCIHGYNKTVEDAPGIARQMRERLCSIAKNEKKFDLAASYYAYEFFYNSSGNTYKELKDASEKINSWQEIRQGVMEYLQTGCYPVSGKDGNGAWPLPPVEIELPPEKEYARGRFPDLQMQTRIAIIEKRNNDAVELYRTLLAQNKWIGGLEEDIAEAVKETHPDLSLQIWNSAAENLIAEVKPKAYYKAAGYLYRMQNVYRNTSRVNEWKALISRLRIEHKSKRRLMEVLDELENGGKAFL